MNKNTLSCLLVTLTFSFISATAISTTAMATETEELVAIPQQCKLLFQQTEELIADAERQPGTHTQIHKMKNKLNQSKKQILAMELTTQTKSCDQGLAKLSSLQQQVE